MPGCGRGRSGLQLSGTEYYQAVYSNNGVHQEVELRVQNLATECLPNKTYDLFLYFVVQNWAI